MVLLLGSYSDSALAEGSGSAAASTGNGGAVAVDADRAGAAIVALAAVALLAPLAAAAAGLIPVAKGVHRWIERRRTSSRISAESPTSADAEGAERARRDSATAPPGSISSGATPGSRPGEEPSVPFVTEGADGKVVVVRPGASGRGWGRSLWEGLTTMGSWRAGAQAKPSSP